MKLIMIAGVNIQSPWSELLLNKQKFIETRSYALPKKHEGSWLALIETPGKVAKGSNSKKARITGLIKFSRSICYNSEAEWVADFESHRVPSWHPVFGYRHDKLKWGWEVEDVAPFDEALPPPLKRGIIFASKCVIPLHLIPV